MCIRKGRYEKDHIDFNCPHWTRETSYVFPEIYSMVTVVLTVGFCLFLLPSGINRTGVGRAFPRGKTAQGFSNSLNY